MVQTCHVCSQPLVGNDVAECMGCGRSYHLAMTQTSTTKDCGVVFYHQEHFYLIFLCQPCQQEAMKETRPGG